MYSANRTCKHAANTQVFCVLSRSCSHSTSPHRSNSNHGHDQTLTNREATQQLQQLYKNKCVQATASEVIDTAFSIYHRIQGHKNKYVINTFIKLLYDYKQTHRVHDIWSDILKTHNIGYTQLLRACVQCESVHIDRCIQILRCIQHRKLQLKSFEVADFSINVSKLIAIVQQQHDDGKQLRVIHSLVRDTDDIYIQTALMNAFGKSRQIEAAESVFEAIAESNKNIICVNTMITIYNTHQMFAQALRLYDRYNAILCEDDTSHLLALKACMHAPDLDKGQQICRHLRDTQNVKLQNALIEFCGLCGDVRGAFKLFHEIAPDHKDVYALSNIMKACIANDLDAEALSMYHTYDSLNGNVSHLLALKACMNLDKYETGKTIHARVMDNVATVVPTMSLWNTLIHFYAHFGQLKEALKVFKHIRHQKATVYTYGTMMKLFSGHKLDKKALLFYDALGAENNEVTDLLAVKACAIVGDYDKGHAILSKYDTHKKPLTVALRSAAMDFYGHFGAVENAKQIFESVSDAEKDAVLVGCMMKVYSNNDRDTRALQIYDQFGHRANEIVHCQAINSCIKTNDFQRGTLIHERVRDNDHIRISTALIDFYARFGRLQDASAVFDGVMVLNTNCINAMLTAYLHNQQFASVLSLYEQYQNLHDDTSHILAIKSCMKCDDKQQWHSLLRKSDFASRSSSSIELRNVLLDAYGHFGELERARQLFASIYDAQKDAVTVNTWMNVLVMREQYENALEVYHRYDTLHDDISHVLAIKACISLQRFDEAQSTHQQKLDARAYAKNIRVQSVLVDLYGHTKNLEMAQDIFHQIAEYELNIVCVNAMMNAFVLNHKNDECLALFANVKHKNANLEPDAVSFAIAIKACTQALYVQSGQDIYARLCAPENVKLLKTADVIVHLIYMFGRFGMMNVCEELFDRVCDYQDVAMCNAMIYVHGQNGDIAAAKRIYKAMIHEMKLTPNSSTYVLLLGACSHCGDLDTAVQIYEQDIPANDPVKYDKYVMANVIDCYSRKGLLTHAEKLIQKYQQITSEIYDNIALASKT